MDFICVQMAISQSPRTQVRMHINRQERRLHEPTKTMTRPASDAGKRSKVISFSEMAPTLAIWSRLQEFLNDPPVQQCRVLHFPMTHDGALGWPLRVPSGALTNGPAISVSMDPQSVFPLHFKTHLLVTSFTVMLFLLFLKTTPEIANWRSLLAQKQQINFYN